MTLPINSTIISDTGLTIRTDGKGKRLERKRPIAQLLPLLLTTDYPIQRDHRPLVQQLFHCGAINQREADWMIHSIHLYLKNESSYSPTGQTYHTILDFLEEIYPDATPEWRQARAKTLLLGWSNKPRWKQKETNKRHYAKQKLKRQAAAAKKRKENKQ